MTRSIVLAATLLLISCGRGMEPEKDSTVIARRDTVVMRDTIRIVPQLRDWQKGFGLTNDPEKDSVWGKPVSYYIQDSACSWTAKDFYYGAFQPDDGGATHDLLAHVYTDNDKLRPFYRWCLTKTIHVADGALWELLGDPARRYVEKFPQEFFTYVDHDTTGEREKEWAGAIGYSGSYRYEDYRRPDLIRKNLLTAMKNNCRYCDAKVISRIEEFARSCFDGEAVAAE
jgi:hypothetical protein